MSADRSMTKDVFHRVSARPVHASSAQTANGRPSPTGPQSSRRARVVSVFKRNLRSCSNRRPLTVSSGAIGTVRRRLACRSSNRSHIFGTSQADPVGVCVSGLQNLPLWRPVGDLVMRVELQGFLAIAHAFPRACARRLGLCLLHWRWYPAFIRSFGGPICSLLVDHCFPSRVVLALHRVKNRRGWRWRREFHTPRA